MPKPVVQAPKEDLVICNWKDCANEARPNSKYCSRNCSNKNARWRHRKRKTDDDDSAQEAS